MKLDEIDFGLGKAKINDRFWDVEASLVMVLTHIIQTNDIINISMEYWDGDTITGSKSWWETKVQNKEVETL